MQIFQDLNLRKICARIINFIFSKNIVYFLNLDKIYKFLFQVKYFLKKIIKKWIQKFMTL